MSHKISKDPLTIRLTESVVFLRGAVDAATGRRRHEVGNGPPAMLRGLLTLHLSKPTRVSSIELELEGKSAVQWPEGTGQRRIDLPEEHKFLSARTVFFSAKTCPSSTRSASLGPSARSLYDDDDYNDNPLSPPPRTPSRLSLDASRPAMATLTPPLHDIRRNSADQYGWQRNAEGSNSNALLSPNYSLTPPASPPYTPEPVYSPLYAEVPLSRPQTPDFHPRTPSWHHSKSLRTEENPGQMLEEFRNTLRMEMGGTIRPTPSRTPSGPSSHTSDPMLPTSDSSSLGLGLTFRSESAPVSRSPSRDIEHRQPRPTSFSMHVTPTSTVSNSPASTVRSTAPAFRSLVSFEHEHEPASPNLNPQGRKSKRWSLSNMSSVFKDKVGSGSPKDAELRRGRTPERRLVNGSNGDNRVDPTIVHEERERKRRDRERKSALGKLTAAVGLDESSNVDGWKEFHKGTYTYPISFAIPPTAPPTLQCDFGAVVYRLKAVVHRPGALTTKLAATREVTLVASPAEDDTEETHSIIVERQWDNQLRYLIALGGRSFAIGSQVPFHLTMVPLEKCKVYRLSVFLEEKTEYYGRSKHITREQPTQRFELLSIRHTDKNAPPILPLSPESASLLTPYLNTTSLADSPDEALASLMGPGPWILAHDLQLPTECGRIHFTYKQKGVNIAVSHTLKIVFRVERGDDQCVDPKTGKRRLFDIVVQTPMYILSCHCNPERTALPRYSFFETEIERPGLHGPVCACSGGSTQFATFSRHQVSPAPTPSSSRPSTANGPNPPGNSNSDTLHIEHVDRMSPPSDLADSSYQFARLVSGQESVLGEAPPGYREVLTRR